MREKRRLPWRGGHILSVKKLSKLKKDLLVKGKDGSFAGNECSSEGEVAPAEREVPRTVGVVQRILGRTQGGKR